MLDRPFLVPQLQLAPLAHWLVMHGPKSPVLDVSSPPGMVCRTVVEEGREAICVTPRRAAADVLTGEFKGSVEVRVGPIATLPLAAASVGSVVAVDPELEGGPLDAALHEFVRVLEDGGLLVVASTASAGSASLRQQQDLYEEVSSHFEHVASVDLSNSLVATLGQGSVVSLPDGADAEGSLPVLLASSRSLPAVDNSYVVMPPPRVAEWLGEWQRVLGDLRAAGTAAQAEAVRESERDRLFGELLDSEQLLADAYDSAAKGEAEVSRAAAQQGELAASRIRLQDGNRHIVELNERIAALNERIAALNERVAFLGQASEEAHARVQAIESSTSWRVTEPLRRLRGVAERPRGK